MPSSGYWNGWLGRPWIFALKATITLRSVNRWRLGAGCRRIGQRRRVQEIALDIPANARMLDVRSCDQMMLHSDYWNLLPRMKKNHRKKTLKSNRERRISNVTSYQ